METRCQRKRVNSNSTPTFTDTTGRTVTAHQPPALRSLGGMNADAHDPFSAAIAPWLSVRRGAEAVRFYVAAFGAIELHHHESDAGEVVSQLSLGGAEFWLADDPECSPETLGAGSVRMIVRVGDPDALVARAVAAGATVIAEVYEDHGWRIGRVRDPFGHHWELARQLH